jgi:hypothetical protein
MEMDNAQSADSQDEQREQVVSDASTERDYEAELPDARWLVGVIEDVTESAGTSGGMCLVWCDDEGEDPPSREFLIETLRETTDALDRIYRWAHVYRLPRCLHCHPAWFDEMVSACRWCEQEMRSASEIPASFNDSDVDGA